MIAGVVLAGGRSSRMGQNKAFLDYHGKPLLEHMIAILKDSRIDDIFISGSVEGYTCIEDSQPYAGPAFAIRHIVRQKPGYSGYLFVPVDMPRLEADVLNHLMSREEGGYFIGCPLPVFLRPPVVMSEISSVQGLVDEQSISALTIPRAFEQFLTNTNTPQEWKEAVSES